jgi:DNA-binding CsgD family transcriptional regulator
VSFGLSITSSLYRPGHLTVGQRFACATPRFSGGSPVLDYFEENREQIERQVKRANFKNGRRNTSIEDLLAGVYIKLTEKFPNPIHITVEVIRSTIAGFLWKDSYEEEQWERRTRLNTDLSAKPGQDEDINFLDSFEKDKRSAPNPLPEETTPKPSKKTVSAVSVEAQQVRRLLKYLTPAERSAMETNILYERYDTGMTLHEFAAPTGGRNNFSRFSENLKRARKHMDRLIHMENSRPEMLATLSPPTADWDQLTPWERGMWGLYKEGLRARAISQRLRSKRESINVRLISIRHRIKSISPQTKKLQNLDEAFRLPPAEVPGAADIWERLTTSQRAALTLISQGKTLEEAHALTGLHPHHIRHSHSEAMLLLGVVNAKTQRSNALDQNYATPPVSIAVPQEKWDTLAPAEKGALTLAEQKKSALEIAAATGISEKTVYTAIGKARKKLGLKPPLPGTMENFVSQCQTAPQALSLSEADWSKLDPPEKVMLTFYSQGKSRKETMGELSISADVSKYYMQKASQKLGRSFVFGNRPPETPDFSLSA